MARQGRNQITWRIKEQIQRQLQKEEQDVDQAHSPDVHLAESKAVHLCSAVEYKMINITKMWPAPLCLCLQSGNGPKKQKRTNLNDLIVSIW